MRSLCVTMFINKRYEPFVPWFITFAHMAYRDAVTLILSSDTFSASTKELINANVPKQAYVLKDRCFPKKLANDPLRVKCFRWVHTDPLWDDFSHVYIGDVDILLAKESPTLLQQHISHMNQTGLPYSNYVRGLRKQHRMSGLHFFDRERWLQSMKPVMDKYRSLLLKGERPANNNEVLLYRMVQEASLPFPKQEHKFRPHHGLHLRIWEAGSPKALLKNSSYPSYWAYFKSVVDTPEVQRLFLKGHEYPKRLVDRMQRFYAKHET